MTAPAVQSLVEAVLAGCSPSLSPDERKQAISVVEQAKAGSPDLCVQAFFLLFQSPDPGAQLNGLTLLRHVLRNRWDALSQEQQHELEQYITSVVMAADSLHRAPPIRMQLAYTLCDVTVQSGDETAKNVLSKGIPQLVQQDASAAIIGCKLTQFLCEEIADTPATKSSGSAAFSNSKAASSTRRSLLTLLTQHGPDLLSLMIQAVSVYMHAGAQATANGQVAGDPGAQAAVQAALEAIAALAAWLPLKVLKESQLLEACTALVQTPELQLPCIEVAVQVASRSSKQTSREGDDYRELLAGIAHFLVSSVPLLAPPDAPLQYMLDNDDAAEATCRLCDALADLVLSGHLIAVPKQLQLQVLMRLAAYLGSEFLPLAARTFPAWRRLVQGYERAVHRSKGAASPTAVELPAECLQVVLQHCVRILHTVIVAPDQEASIPDYAHDAAEWREACSACKSAVKYIMAEVGAAMTTGCLGVVGGVVETVAAALAASARGAGERVVPEAAHALDVLAFVLDAIMAPLCQYASEGQSRASLAALGHQVMQFQASHITLVPRIGKVLEALAPMLILLPDEAPRVINAFFALVDRMHELRGRAPVDTAERSTQLIKEQRALSKCYYVLAAKAPRAFVPHLESIAQRTMDLVARGALGYADKNTICEGLLASAAAEGGELFGSVVQALVGPVQQPWGRLAEQLRGPEDLVGQMLGPVQPAADGTQRIGGNDGRSFVYYSMQLLLYCARQAKSCPQQQGYEVLSHHIEWMLPAAVQLHTCIMGLAQPTVLQGPLAAVQQVLEISPLERAACVNQHAFMEAKSRTDELETGRMDPSSVHAVRGWIRQCKELALMLVMECARGVPSFWTSERLRSTVPGSLLFSLELQEARAMRLTVHHGFLPLVRHCPPGAAAAWLADAVAQFVHVMSTRLHSMWPGLTARVRGDVGDANSKQTEDEMVQEVLLRELSRDVLEVLRALAGSTSFPTIPTDQLHVLEHSNPLLFGAMRKLKHGAPPSSSPSPTPPREKAVPVSLSSISWDQTIAHALAPSHSATVTAAVQLAASAMLWPDLQTQLRAVAVCRTVAAAAGAPLNPVATMCGAGTAYGPGDASLQPLLPTLLGEAVRALAAVDGAHVASELLLLIRSIYIGQAARQPGTQIRELLPSVSPIMLEQLDKELEGNKTEKHHKDVLKRFFVAAGFENLEMLSETKKVATAGATATAANAGNMDASDGVDNEVQWPDLYDIVVDPN